MDSRLLIHILISVLLAYCRLPPLDSTFGLAGYRVRLSGPSVLADLDAVPLYACSRIVWHLWLRPDMGENLLERWAGLIWYR